MKKLLIFDALSEPDTHGLDDYMRVSELNRSDYIDLNPMASATFTSVGVPVFVTDWDLLFKESDLFDMWHLVCSSDCRLPATFLEQYRIRRVCDLQMVLDKGPQVVFVYRISKGMSAYLSERLQDILDAFDGEKFCYEIAKEITESFHVEEKTDD